MKLIWLCIQSGNQWCTLIIKQIKLSCTPCKYLVWLPLWDTFISSALPNHERMHRNWPTVPQYKHFKAKLCYWRRSKHTPAQLIALTMSTGMHCCCAQFWITLCLCLSTGPDNESNSPIRVTRTRMNWCFSHCGKFN